MSRGVSQEFLTFGERLFYVFAPLYLKSTQ